MANGRRVLFAVLLAGLCLPANGADESKGDVAVFVSKTDVTFRAGKQLVGVYRIGESVAKPYLYPLHAPGGLKVTRGVPPESGSTTDHPHQKSVWFCHGDVIPEGLEVKDKIKNVKGVDFWSEAPGHGKMVCVKAEPRDNGVATHNEWRTADGIKIMDESRVVTLHAVEGGYLFVFDIDLHASVCPITFGDTKEGSFGVRVPDIMTEKNKGGTLTNAEGKSGEKAIWGFRSKWCDYSGAAAGEEGAKGTAGVAIFDDSGNKTPACWHSRGYGLMAANPFGRASFPGTKEDPQLVKIAKGDHLKLRYGVFVHKGDAKEGKVAEAYAAFAKMK